MANTLTQSCTNQSVQELRDQWLRWNRSSRPGQLWILCSDRSMDSMADYICDNSRALVLRTPAVHFGIASTETDVGEAIDFALTEVGVSKIVLCGHSQCQSFRAAEPAKSSAASDFLSQVRQIQKRNQAARNHLIEQLQQLKALPEVSRLLAQKELTVDGLFYVAESGIFSRHDEVTGRFVGILEGVVTG